MTLTPGQSTAVNVTFTPQSAGSKAASLEVTHDGSNASPLVVPLTGSGQVAGVSNLGSAPSTLSFGTVTVGANGVQSVQLTNMGGSGSPDIVVQSTLLSGSDAVEFSDDFSSSVTLTPGQSTAVNVTFTPQGERGARRRVWR